MHQHLAGGIVLQVVQLSQIEIMRASDSASRRVYRVFWRLKPMRSNSASVSFRKRPGVSGDGGIQTVEGRFRGG